MIIVEAVKFFVDTMNLSWWALGRLVIPGTIVNGQFLFIFSLVLLIGWKLIINKTMPPVKVDNVEIENNTSKKNEKFNNISRKRK